MMVMPVIMVMMMMVMMVMMMLVCRAGTDLLLLLQNP